jgi:hypothetical protein
VAGIDKFYQVDGQWVGVSGDESKEILKLVPRSKRAEHLINSVGDIVAKRCTDCGQMTLLEDFHVRVQGLGGKDCQCKKCRIDHKKNVKNGGEKKGPTPKPPAERVWENGMCIRKKCPDCNEWRDRSEYSTCSTHKDGLQTQCTTCQNGRNNDWKLRNPEAVSTNRQNRRAREKLLLADLKEKQWETILRRKFKGRCALTGEESDLHLEHAIPLAIGHGGTTEWNCYPLVGRLNSSKNASNLFEWIKRPEIESQIKKPRFNSLIKHLADKCGLTVNEYIEFYQWCFNNPRLTVEEIERDGDVSSLFLWRKATGRAV